MAWLADTYTWAAFETTLKEYLGITVSTYDVRLQQWLSAVLDEADNYIGHPWLNTDTNADFPNSITPLWIRTRYGSGVAAGGDIPPPQSVETGILDTMRMTWEVLAGPTARPFGLTSAKTGDLSESYAVGSRIAGGNVSLQDIINTNKTHWRRYRVDITY